MNHLLLWLFWLSAGLLAYHLVGYGALLYLWNKLFKKKHVPTGEIAEYPKITVLCPAFNEEKVI